MKVIKITSWLCGTCHHFPEPIPNVTPDKWTFRMLSLWSRDQLLGSEILAPGNSSESGEVWRNNGYGYWGRKHLVSPSFRPYFERELAHVLWSMDSTTLDSITLGFNKPWIQQSHVEQPLDSTTLGFNNFELQNILVLKISLDWTIPRFNKHLFTQYWTQHYLDSTIFISMTLWLNLL